MKINIEVDVAELRRSIDNAPALEDNEGLFRRLSEIAKWKATVSEAMESIETLEQDVKGMINTKAQVLYGPDWQTIAGKGYKITRSKTGSIYTRNPDIPIAKRFVEIKEILLTKEIDAEIEKTGKLPKGVELNPSRGESIRITVK